VTELSADWVLPVDGPPIEGGRVRFEDGRLIEVGPGRAERHFADAAIVPGFVNAHSHLEYSVYAGFGDGMPFGPWIKTHVDRKNRLTPEEMLAIARSGVVESLATGITTTADYSFSGHAATAAAEIGLRAIVFLEVFAADPADAGRRFEEKSAGVEETRLVTIGISPHAPYTCSLETYRWCLSLGIPVGTHLAESAAENEWLEHGTGALEGIPILVPPTGKRAVASLEPVLRPQPALRTLRGGERRRDRVARRAQRARRALSSLECPPRLRHRTARRPAGGRRRRRSRDGLACVGPVVRRLRGDAGGDLCGARPGAAGRRATRERRPPPRDARCRPCAANRRGRGYADARQAR